MRTRCPGHDGDSGAELRGLTVALQDEGIHHARLLLDHVEVGGLHRAAGRRAFHIRGVEQVRQAFVDAEQRLAGNQRAVVHAADALAENPEIGRVLQRHFVGVGTGRRAAAAASSR
jgi:hypothetical protein